MRLVTNSYLVLPRLFRFSLVLTAFLGVNKQTIMLCHRECVFLWVPCAHRNAASKVIFLRSRRLSFDNTLFGRVGGRQDGPLQALILVRPRHTCVFAPFVHEADVKGGIDAALHVYDVSM